MSNYKWIRPAGLKMWVTPTMHERLSRFGASVGQRFAGEDVNPTQCALIILHDTAVESFSSLDGDKVRELLDAGLTLRGF